MSRLWIVLDILAGVIASVYVINGYITDDISLKAYGMALIAFVYVGYIRRKLKQISNKLKENE